MTTDGKEDDSPPGGGISRRDFLRGGAVAGALGSAGMLAGEIAEAARKNPAAAPDGMEVWGPEEARCQALLPGAQSPRGNGP